MSEREELCVYCMKLVKDWVEPDWAYGRICRECETIHDPENCTESVSPETVKKAQDSIAKLRAKEAEGKSKRIWNLWFHRLNQWDIGCNPIICIHWKYDQGNGCKRIFCLWSGGIAFGRKRFRWKPS